MNKFYPEKIFVEEEVEGFALTKQVVERCKGVPVEMVKSAKDLIASLKGKRFPLSEGKKNLLLCRNRGRFLEPCPGTKKDYLCCGYAILNTGTGCPLDCSYCVLQAYLNNPFITLFVNRQEMMDELLSGSILGRGKIIRIGTGEYMDSLALEHLTGFIPFILPFLRKRPDLILELKTKTTHIENLIDLDHGDSFVISWSLNAEKIRKEEEKGTASVKDRIKAASLLIEKGYRVSFHFDPVIYYPGWEQDYQETIELLKENIPPDKITWISIGSLRYMPGLKNIAQKRFSDTGIYSQEFISGLDGKMRYLQGQRTEMYQKMCSLLKAYSTDILIYYCMESKIVWERTLGFSSSSNIGLKSLLDKRVLL